MGPSKQSHPDDLRSLVFATGNEALTGAQPSKLPIYREGTTLPRRGLRASQCAAGVKRQPSEEEGGGFRSRYSICVRNRIDEGVVQDGIV